ncbi:MAG: hypothetical protein NT062_32490 [Proteobacteria bacterium]|nr:hypothetical protein [Pseudomonadota bacterium]
MRWILLTCSTLAACAFQGHGELPIDGGADGGVDAVVDAPPDTAPPPDAPARIVTLGLIEDLDANFGATATTWENQVTGFGDNVTTTAGTITYTSNAINGHAALAFPGSARMAGTDTTAFAGLVAGGGLTWFAVVNNGTQRNTGAVDRNQIFGTIHEGGNNSGFTAGVDRSDHPYTMIRPATMEFKAQSPVATAGTWVVLAGRLAAGPANVAATIHLNSSTASGTKVVTATATALTGALTIGAERTLGAEFYTGMITRILIYDRPLTDDELAMTGRALGVEYAIPATF